MVQNSGLSATQIDCLNRLNEAELQEALLKCNGSSEWTRRMLSQRPFANADALFCSADETWMSLSRSDWMEGFAHHPRIGDLESLKKKFSSTSNWSKSEQSSVNDASEQTLIELRDGNLRYEEKFGFIFIVCATGKSAAEMLQLLRERMHNDADTELRVALTEHAKITRLRLEKLCQELAR